MGNCRLLFLQLEDTVVQYVLSIFDNVMKSSIVIDQWSDDLRTLNTILKGNQYSFIVVGKINESVYKIILDSILTHSIKSSWILYCEKEKYIYERQFLPIFFALRKESFHKDCVQLGLKLKMQQVQQKTYSCHQKSKQMIVHVNKIYYIESDKNYIAIHQEHRVMRDRITLKEIQNNEIFIEFILISRGLFVNPHHVKGVNKKQIQLDNGEQLYMSRTQRKYVFNEMKEYLV